MDNDVIILRYSEIHLKGKNRGYFEKLLRQNILTKISKFDAKLENISGRYLVRNFSEKNRKKIQDVLLKTSGLYSISRGVEVEASDEIISQSCILAMQDKTGSFRVTTTRADKNFPYSSMEYSAKIGEKILESNSKLRVDLHKPDTNLQIDIRINGKAYIYFDEMLAVNGMPVSSSGKGLLLLSGGIDSPVAGYMMSKRGMKLSAIHFESFPYTSPQAKEKAVELASVLVDYNGPIKLYVANIASIQEEIHKNCHPDYMITLVRRFMLRIAQNIATKNHLQAIITGESLGQVASQTIESMSTIGSVLSSNMPLLKPLVGFDKQETVEIAKKIGSYDISIRPYDDCCTVFLPKSPVIKPRVSDAEQQEKRLDVDKLVEEVIDKIDIIQVGQSN